MTSPIKIDDCFQALSDVLRLNILDLLKEQELCVCDLCKTLDVSQSRLSFHLKRLREAELVISRQDGRWIFYRLNSSKYIELQNFLAVYAQAKPRLDNECG